MKHIFELIKTNLPDHVVEIGSYQQRDADEKEHKRIVGEIFKGVEEGICSWSTSNYKGEWTTDIPMVWKEVKELKQKYLGEDGQH